MAREPLIDGVPVLSLSTAARHASRDHEDNICSFTTDGRPLSTWDVTVAVGCPRTGNVNPRAGGEAEGLCGGDDIDLR